MDFDLYRNRTLQESLNDDMKRAVMPVTVFVGIEIVLGFLGNLVVLYVFMFRYHRCNFRYFVLCLAVTDITSTLTTMPGEIVTQLYWYIYPFPIICKIKSFFNVFTVSSEAFCLLTIAVERYRKVCRPHKWQIRPNIAKILCFVIYVAAFIVSFPVALFWGTHQQIDKYMQTNVTTRVCALDQTYVNTNKPFHYSLSIEIVISISLLSMLLLYVCIAKTLLCNKLWRNSNHKSFDIQEKKTYQTSNQPFSLKSEITLDKCSDECMVPGIQNQEIMPQTRRSNTEGSPQPTSSRISKMSVRVRRNTLIMLLLTVTFLVTTIMYLTLLSYIADDILPSLSDSERTVYFFFFRFYFINHVINPFVYGFMDPTFRRVLFSCKKFLSDSKGRSSSSVA